MGKIVLIPLLLFAFISGHSTRITSNGSGPFTSGATWLGGVVPGPSDTAVISNTDSVTLSFQTVTLMALVIEPQGKLALWSGTMQLADTLLNLGFMAAYSASSVNIYGLPEKGVDNRGHLLIGFGTTWVVGASTHCNRLFLSSGDMVVKPNSVTSIYGRTRIISGNLTQDGGNVIFYGNSGSAATSVPATDNIVFMDATAFNCTAGSMTIADAHHESFFPMVNTVEITGNNPLAFSGSHTWYIGDAISNKPAHLNRGISLGNGQKNGMKAPVNHLWVQTRYIGQRFFYTSITPNSGTYMNGDFKVVFQSEAKHVWVTGVEMAIGGDLEVDDGSFFTNSQPITLGAGSGYSIAKKQVVYSSGTIRDDVFNPAFQFGALVFNNSLAGDTAVRFTSGSTIKVRDSVVFLAGVAAMHSLQLGNADFVCKSRVVNGGVIPAAANTTTVNITRFYRQSLGNTAGFGSGFDVFPFASATDFTKRTLQVQFQQVSAGGRMQAIFYDGIGAEPAHQSIHGTDNGVFCNTLSRQYWNLDAGSGLDGTGVQVRCTGGNLILDGNAANIRLHKLGSAISGTSQGGGTLLQPVATRVNINTAMEANGSYYLAGNNSLMITKIPSAASGQAENPASWKYNRVPDLYYGAIVKNGHQLSYASAPVMQLLSLEIEAGGSLLLSRAGGIFTVVRKTVLHGLLEVNADCRARLSKIWEQDTSLYIGSTGSLRLNHAAALVVLMHGLSNEARTAGMVNYGTLHVANGKVYCLGYMHHAGNSNFLLGDDAQIVIAGSSIQPMHNQTMLLLATSGKVDGGKGSIVFTDPPQYPNQLTLNIVRNTPGNISLAKTRFICGRSLPEYQAGYGNGAALTGYKLETEGGAVNVPIGKVFAAQSVLPGSNRFVRNGNRSLFMADGLTIFGDAMAHFFPSTGETIIGGLLDNYGLMVSEGKLIFGGTAQFGGEAYIQLKAFNEESQRYTNAVTNPTANFNEIEIRHWGKVVRADFNVTVADKLALTRGFFYPTKGLTLGIGTGHTGELQMTDGRLLAGEPYVFHRWYSTATINQGSINALYPFAIEGFDRFVYLSGTPLSGGTMGISHTSSPAVSAELPPKTEAGSTVNRGFTALWKGYPGNGYTNQNIGLRVAGGGFAVKQADKVRLLNTGYNLLAGGTHLSAGGNYQLITVERTGVTPALLADGFRFGVPGSELYLDIRSVKSGNWASESTWDCNCVPFSQNTVLIEPGHQVTLQPNSGNNLRAANIVIGSNALLNIKGDSLQANVISTGPLGELHITGGVLIQTLDGYSGGGQPLSLTKLMAGKYILASTSPAGLPGTHHRYFLMSNNGWYEQSGGELYSEYPLYAAINSRITVTGGLIYLKTDSPNPAFPQQMVTSPLTLTGSDNPGYAKTFSNSTLVIANPIFGFNKYALVASGANISFSNHTLMLGDTAMPVEQYVYNPDGFRIQTNVKLSHLTIAGNGITSGRHAGYDASFNQHFACHNLYITKNSEWRNPDPSNPGFKVFIHGNLVNEGNYTNYLATTVLGGGFNGSVANTPQYLSGSGRFRFMPSAPTAMEPMINFFEINNLSSEGVTLERNLKVSQLNMVNGDIHADTLQVGTSDWDWGEIIPSGTGAIVGHVTKWIRNIPHEFNMPVGVKGVRRNLKMTITQAPNPSGLLGFSFTGKPGGAMGLPLQEGGIGLVTTAPEGYWKLSNMGAGNTWYQVEATASALGNVTDYTQLVLLKRNAGSPNWVKEGNHAVATGNNSLATLYRSNLFGFGDFAIALGQVPAIPALSVWTGNVSSEWYNAANWSNGVPGSSTAATIPGARPRYPVVTHQVNIKSLHVQSGAAIQLEKQIPFTINGQSNQ